MPDQRARPYACDTLIAEAWALRHGRKTCFSERSQKDGNGLLLAKASATMMLAGSAAVEAAAIAATGASE